MSNYLDLLMTNKIFDENMTDELISDETNSDTYPSNVNLLKGGDGETGNMDNPNGGFPPIIIIERERAIKKEESKNRELGGVVVGISIKDILGKKKS